MERLYFAINEDIVKRAQQATSFYEYVPNKQTREYEEAAHEVYDLAEKVEQKFGAKKGAEAWKLAERYAEKLAEWINKYHSIRARVPSIMIAGGSNFPVKQKEKQNRAMDAHMKDNEKVEYIRKKIENMLYGKDIIKSGDNDAIERLEQKIKNLTDLQEKMKAVNAYYRKHKKLDGCEILTEEEIRALNADMVRDFHLEDKPYPTWALSNNRQNIKSAEKRLNELKSAKDQGTKEEVNEYFKVVENTEIMRLQVFFDDKPDEDVRIIMKKHGFKWSPTQGAWQRQLTNNARYALKQVLKELTERYDEINNELARRFQ